VIANFFQLYEKSKVVIEPSAIRYSIYQLLSDGHGITLSKPSKTTTIAQAKVKTVREWAFGCAQEFGIVVSGVAAKTCP